VWRMKNDWEEKQKARSKLFSHFKACEWDFQGFKEFKKFKFLTVLINLNFLLF
jgi:hypothetical protein